jgi:hypothetical protein
MNDSFSTFSDSTQILESLRNAAEYQKAEVSSTFAKLQFTYVLPDIALFIGEAFYTFKFLKKLLFISSKSNSGGYFLCH